MFPPTLTRAAQKAYLEATTAPHVRATIRVDVLDLDHKHQQTLAEDVISGHIDFNRGADVDRTGRVTVSDFNGEVADLDLRHLIRVRHGIDVAGYGWVWCPIITGRVMAPADDGDTATLQLHGKDSFGLLPGARSRKWHKGLTVAKAIREMHEDIGETKFNISPGLINDGPRLRSDVVSGGPDEKKAPTRVARRMARRAGLQVFYDALGRLTVRRTPSSPVVTWSEEADTTGQATSLIQWNRDLSTIRNTVVAKGKKGVSVRVTADPDHIYSPRSLARGGVPGRLVHYWSDDTITRERELRQSAEKILRKLLTERADARFPAVPVYHVEPHDLVRAVRRDGRYADFWLNEATIPLDPSEAMSVGYRQLTRRGAGRVSVAGGGR